MLLWGLVVFSAITFAHSQEALGAADTRSTELTQSAFPKGLRQQRGCVKIKGSEELRDSGLISQGSPVEVAVYYEALCPDSRSFITRQLLPAFLKGPNVINPVFIPYGKAETRETLTGYEFTCQHGPIECQGNKIHGCAASIIPNNEIKVRYIACMISNNMNPEDIGEKCASKFGVAWDQIFQCSRAREGDELLKANGDTTAALNPSVTFIPTITLNGSQGSQTAILKNLWQEVCKVYTGPKPAECP